MFESIRKHAKGLMFLLLLLVIPSFILVGIDRNYFSNPSVVVARVDGQDITQAEWDNAHRNQSDRLRTQMPDIDAQLLDSPAARYTVLENLVRERVLLAAARSMHLMTSDASLARALQAIPEIADLRKEDGTLDVAAYRVLVGRQGLTPEGFEAGVRQQLSANQVLNSLESSAFSSQAQTQLVFNALLQRREIQTAHFAAADFMEQVTPSDDDLETYYKAHADAFQQVEQATVEYLVLDVDAVKKDIHISEDDLHSYYEENKERFATQEERRASHILINAREDSPAAERAQAKTQAEALLAQVRKNPSSFAEVAKKSSQDPGSASNGGDLGFFTTGAMVKPFEEAVFAMNKGDISEVVKSDFGYHIIQLTDIKAARLPSFEEKRAALEADLRQQQAQTKFAEVAETFSNAVYEQADSLQGAAESLGLAIQTATGITRTPQPGHTGALAHERFLQALFQPEALQGKNNTEAIEIASNTLAAGRIVDYQPAMILPLEQVKEQVRTRYIAEQSAQLARQAGETQLAAWRAADPQDAASKQGSLSEALTVSRDQPAGQPITIINAALRAPIDRLPAWEGVDLGAQGYAVIKINQVLEREPHPPEQQQEMQRMEQQQYTQAWQAAEAAAYYELLKERLKVQMKVPKPSAEPDMAAD